MKKPMFLLIAITFLFSCSTFTPATSNAEPSYRYDNLPDGDVNILNSAEFRVASQWGKTNITYFFINGTDKISGDEERQLVKSAFALWAANIPLIFTETSDRNKADIVIGWAEGEHGDGDSFDGAGNVLAHASYPNPYSDKQVFLHFDDSERWVNSDNKNVDLLTVAAHEIGHTLGLNHSTDKNALMFPSYSRPHRFLGDDDVAGVQSVYGLASTSPSAPQLPKPNENPPQSPNNDTDQDGLSDSDETLVTGTDPNKPDTDNDGLGDGVEVANRMNPLDADMDKDGSKDGAEIAAGTNPFLPDQTNGVSPELAKEVGDFLTNAIKLQIKAYREGDASVASTVLGGEILENLFAEIDSLNQQGLVEVAEIDYYKSYVADIKIINAAQIEAKTCEVWTTQFFQKSDGKIVQTIEATLLPQTIIIQKIGENWFITKVNFEKAPAFCK